MYRSPNKSIDENEKVQDAIKEVGTRTCIAVGDFNHEHIQWESTEYCEGGSKVLQDDLNKLTEWSKKWQMLFSFWNCQCLHTGHGNEDAQCMGCTVQKTTIKEKDY